MSSGFVSAGTVVESPTDTPTDAWTAAKAAVEEAKKPPEAEPEEERSLFAILQANKAKKQEEFEEKLKFKNQFKPLDEDDVEYLDSILSNERRAEEARKQELEAQLDAFRQQQSEVDRGGVGGSGEGETVAVFGTWKAGGRKRRRKKEEGGKGLGVKVRKMSGTEKKKEETKTPIAPEKKKEGEVKKEVKEEAPVVPKTGGLVGLVAYRSDDDSD